jgi:hypothetical protein
MARENVNDSPSGSVRVGTAVLGEAVSPSPLEVTDVS